MNAYTNQTWNFAPNIFISIKRDIAEYKAKPYALSPYLNWQKDAGFCSQKDTKE